MRSEPAKVGTKGTRGRTLRGSRRELARNSMLRRIALEALEPRTLMAVLPTPTVLPNSQVDVSTSRGNESSPAIAIDQLNPNKLAAVWVRNDPALAPGRTVFVEMAYSNNAGQTWTQISPGGFLPNPTTSNPTVAFPTSTDPSVAFD